VRITGQVSEAKKINVTQSHKYPIAVLLEILMEICRWRSRSGPFFLRVEYRPAWKFLNKEWKQDKILAYMKSVIFALFTLYRFDHLSVHQIVRLDGVTSNRVFGRTAKGRLVLGPPVIGSRDFAFVLFDDKVLLALRPRIDDMFLLVRECRIMGPVVITTICRLL
jgi:hypothetical protein